MSRSYKGTSNVGKSMTLQTSGCSWCLHEQRPAYTTEILDLELGGRKIVKYIGQGICEYCVHMMKRKLQTPGWSSERRVFFDKKQYCCDCEIRGVLVPAMILDHIVPWRFAPDLFWETNNWQGLCFDCHDAKSRLEQTYDNLKNY